MISTPVSLKILYYAIERLPDKRVAFEYEPERNHDTYGDEQIQN